jgi:hypothetical protein
MKAKTAEGAGCSRLDLARPATQVAFNLKKGSLPVRGDVDLAAANDCMKKGLDILAKGNIIVSVINYCPRIRKNRKRIWRPNSSPIRASRRGRAEALRRDHRGSGLTRSRILRRVRTKADDPSPLRGG